MNEILADFFRHNRWANEQLLDACAGLTPEQLDAGNPGAYGTVADTLTHLLGAEERYVTILTGQPAAHPLREADGFPGFEELKQRAARSGAALVEIAGSAQPGAILRGERRDQPYAFPIEMILLQAINHATEHRTNVTTILAQQDIQPPEIDGWGFLPELANRQSAVTGT